MSVQVSVIVPIYNARELMFCTVDSILAQTLGELELLLVDDCSTDGSAHLLEERYAGDGRVRVIRQERNGGPGEARNRGIEEAAGEYICFCDSDDQLPKDALKEMYTAAVEWDADVVHSSGTLFSLRDHTPEDMLQLADDELCVVHLDRPAVSEPTLLDMTPEELLERWTRHEFHWSAWNKLYRRSLLLEHHIRFGRMRLAEDQMFGFCCLFSAERYLLLPGARYYYRQAESSLSRGKATMGFLLRCLTAAFEVSRSMEAFTDEHPWLRENPQAADRATAYILECIEMAYTRRTWNELGTEAILKDEGIRQLFRDRCGEGASYALKLCSDAHGHPLPANTILEKLNSPSGLRQLVEAGMLHTLREWKEMAGGTRK